MGHAWQGCDFAKIAPEICHGIDHQNWHRVGAAPKREGWGGGYTSPRACLPSFPYSLGLRKICAAFRYPFCSNSALAYARPSVAYASISPPAGLFRNYFMPPRSPLTAANSILASELNSPQAVLVGRAQKPPSIPVAMPNRSNHSWLGRRPLCSGTMPLRALVGGPRSCQH